MYGSISTSYLQIQQNQNQPASEIVNAIHEISLPWFKRYENYSFKYASNKAINFGHMLTTNFGYELSVSYLKPLNVNDNFDENFDDINRTMKGDFFQSFAKFVFNIPVKKINVYSKIGLNVVTGKMSYTQSLYTNKPEEIILKYDYTKNLSLGFNASIGFDFPILNRLSIFSELALISQSFSPKKGEMVQYTSGGIDQSMYFNNKPYNYQIDFGEEYQWQMYGANDGIDPQKLYRRTYSLGGYGLTLGVKYCFWKKSWRT